LNRVWLVWEENEYGKSVAMVCGNPELAEKARDLLQGYADEGEKPDNDLHQTFYGRYSVEERRVADRASEAEVAWHLSPEWPLPEGWEKGLRK
jgi:hypothetical protein